MPVINRWPLLPQIPPPRRAASFGGVSAKKVDLAGLQGSRLVRAALSSVDPLAWGELASAKEPETTPAAAPASR